MLLRHACPSDLPVLTELALRSKAYWGYTEAFVEACRNEFVANIDAAEPGQIAVGYVGNKPIGFVQVEIKERTAELMMLFIEPTHIGKGYGGRLFQWAVAKSTDAGATRMMIEADPYAAGFYEKVGAHRIGTVPSVSFPDRGLPWLQLDLRPRSVSND